MKPQQIEQTGKRYKGMIALGVMAIIVGIIWRAFASASDADSSGSGVAIAGGLVAYVAGRFLAWWNHG